MALTFLDLYNTAASQEWSMYDNDATKNDEFEQSLVIDLNKAVTEILYSFPFSFRERTHVLFTIPKMKSYDMPKGLILKSNSDEYYVKINSKPLKLIKDPFSLDEKYGIPQGFYIRGSKLVLYPTPMEKFIVTVDYLTLAVGENNSNEEIYTLKDKDDVILMVISSFKFAYAHSCQNPLSCSLALNGSSVFLFRDFVSFKEKTFALRSLALS